MYLLHFLVISGDADAEKEPTEEKPETNTEGEPVKEEESEDSKEEDASKEDAEHVEL